MSESRARAGSAVPGVFERREEATHPTHSERVSAGQHGRVGTVGAMVNFNPLTPDSPPSDDHPDQGKRPGFDGIEILSPRAEWDRLAAAWLMSTEAESTKRTYKWAIDRYFDWCETAGVDALAPRRVGIDGFRQWRKAAGDKRSTLARKLSTLSSFYTYASIEYPELVTHHPLANVKRPKVSRVSNRRALDANEAEDMIRRAELAGGRDAAVVTMLVFTGLRVSELRGATLDRLGRESGTHVVTVTRKGGKDGTVPIHDRAWSALSAYLASRDDVHPPAGRPLILGVRGGPISRDEVAQTLDRYALAEWEKRITPHTMRHSFATLSLKGGADPLHVQEVMGHASIQTTMGYVHLKGRVDRSPAHALAKLLGEGR